MSDPAPTIRQLLAAAATCLAAAESARSEAELLLAAVLDRPRAWLYAHDRDVAPPAVAAGFAALLTRRAAGEPLAYLTGKRGFWTLDLAVTPDVLIPRADTERLVELALQRIAPESDVAVADLGTGSGAIALALASERPRARILATDLSAAALGVARTNAARLGIANVEFVRGDWAGALGTRRFALIASNPPYIRADDPHLGQGDLRHEPLSALASGEDGLDAIRAIVAAAPAHLDPGGWLLLEHGYDQGAAVRALLEAHGLVQVATAQDLEARDRVSLGQRPE
ncbi:peptide chain release factor N(5)-glutamine methyltransferase [Dokdonella koreensis]|uniref:Release factor glutamine methyltransferase n=1 Tax=Dokdonella koreensis DS-123 TaxID=1300342 RepID=A0A160DRJ9_9GAMM|nr:peptide chain release factor N(5)-glutamine methyltransferase [Dokdonella koreensis]ANB16777.1 Protein-N(5)-glutamine methyltransferase PrmC [Dokdonella koreensis DS-123]